MNRSRRFGPQPLRYASSPIGVQPPSIPYGLGWSQPYDEAALGHHHARYSSQSGCSPAAAR